MKYVLIGVAMFSGFGLYGTARANCTDVMRAKFKAAEQDRSLHMPTKAEADAEGDRCFHDPQPRRALPPAELDRILAQLLTSDSPLFKGTQPDFAQICPHYSQMATATRLVVWRGLFKGMIGAESSGYRDVDFWENGNPQSVNGEYSVGLIQLSISNARPYACDLPDEMSLKDPAHNLACAIKIMTKLTTPRLRKVSWAPPLANGVKRKTWSYQIKDPGGIGGPNAISVSVVDNVPGRPPLPPQWTGAARYWATLRGPRIRVIEWLSKNLPQCGLPNFSRKPQ